MVNQIKLKSLSINTCLTGLVVNNKNCLQIWGVDVASGNAIAWLDCVAKGRKVTLQPLANDNNDLVSTVSLHLPQPQV